MRTLCCLITFIMLLGCVRCPDSISVSPIIEQHVNREVSTVDDLISITDGGLISFKWYYGGTSEFTNKANNNKSSIIHIDSH